MVRLARELGLVHPLDQETECAGAVAELIFNFSGQDAEGLCVTIRGEERIVAKAAAALFDESERAFDGSGVGAEDLAVSREGNAAAKAAGKDGGGIGL